MKKVIKILLIFVAAFLIIFGVLGVIMELTSENTELFGIILGVVYIIIGGSLLNMGIRREKAKASETVETLKEKEPAASPVDELKTPETGTDESLHPFWQRKALIISSWIEIVFFVLGIVFALIFGIAGFVSGEMGTMIGILMTGVVIAAGTVVSMKISALWGFVKRKRWAPIVNLILLIGLTAFAISIKKWPVIAYFGFTGWCSIYLIKHPSS